MKTMLDNQNKINYNSHYKKIKGENSMSKLINYNVAVVKPIVP